jgi:hypothetical protein
MSKLLLNLRHVPDDEAADVRKLLDEQGIAWYETDPGNWWISAGGIWVKHDGDLARAKQAMAVYQSARADTARAAHARDVTEGRAETFSDRFRADPAGIAVRILGMLLILALMALPVVLLFR